MLTRDDFKKLRVLIVEDHATTRDLICEILHHMGIRAIQTAEDGILGIHQLKQRVPDVILLDWRMDRMSGLEFSHWVRNHPESPDPEMPIVMVSAHTSTDSVHEAVSVGVTEVVTKPVSPMTLRQKISRSLGLRPLRADLERKEAPEAPQPPIESRDQADQADEVWEI
ncbi:MAG: response regulator [Pseudomonadota bacterium]